MKLRYALAVATAIFVTSAVSAANAAAEFNFTFTTSYPLPSNGCCGPFDVTAKLLGTLSGSSYDITGITGTVTEGAGADAVTYDITGLIPGTSDPLGDFGFDNLVNTTSGTGPYSLDNGGLAFYATNPSYYAETNADPASSLSAFNVYGNGGSDYGLSTTASYDVNTVFNGVATITAVPEPASWALMLAGIGVVGGVLRMARRQSGTALAAA